MISLVPVPRLVALGEERERESLELEAGIYARGRVVCTVNRPRLFQLSQLQSESMHSKMAVAREPVPALKNIAGSPYVCMGTTHACALVH